jgi:hypothetical protein
VDPVLITFQISSYSSPSNGKKKRSIKGTYAQMRCTVIMRQHGGATMGGESAMKELKPPGRTMS